jgi:multidrug efflux pump subunit AcrA (membrane-fusion protein)
MKVENTKQDGKIPLTGRVIAAEQVDIFAELGGTATFGGTPFKAGHSFRKGELMLSIDKSEIKRTLAASKSGLVSLIVKSLADIKLDYPEAFDAWKAYAADLDINKPLPKLPAITNEKLRFYLTGKNLYTTYYNILQSEERLRKYDIRAPFNGTLTEANLFEGTLVRVGQPLGEFMRTDYFELEASTNYRNLQFLQKGQEITFYDVNHATPHPAKLIRINEKVDPATQLVKLYFTMKSEGLKSGLYMEADLVTNRFEEAALIPASAVLEEAEKVFVYSIKSGKARKTRVELLDRGAEQVLVKGLASGMVIVIDKKNSAFEGSAVTEMSKS